MKHQTTFFEDELREPGGAELCIFDPVEDMPGYIRDLYNSTDTRITLYRDPNGHPLPQVSRFVRKEDPYPSDRGASTKTTYQRLLEKSLELGFIGYEEFFNTNALLSQLQEKPEAFKEIRNSIISRLQEVMHSEDICDQKSILSLCNGAELPSIENLAEELDIETVTLFEGLELKKKGANAPRYRLLYSCPDEGKSGQVYQSWQELTPRAGISPTPKVSALNKELDDAFAKGRLKTPKWLYGKIKELFPQDSPTSRKIGQRLWNHYKILCAIAGIDWIKERFCRDCGEKIEEDICPNCESDNTNTYPISVAHRVVSKYTKLPLGGSPDVVQMEANQKFQILLAETQEEMSQGNIQIINTLRYKHRKKGSN